MGTYTYETAMRATRLTTCVRFVRMCSRAWDATYEVAKERRHKLGKGGRTRPGAALAWGCDGGDRGQRVAGRQRHGAQDIAQGQQEA